MIGFLKIDVKYWDILDSPGKDWRKMKWENGYSMHIYYVPGTKQVLVYIMVFTPLSNLAGLHGFTAQKTLKLKG